MRCKELEREFKRFVEQHRDMMLTADIPFWVYEDYGQWHYLLDHNYTEAGGVFYNPLESGTAEQIQMLTKLLGLWPHKNSLLDTINYRANHES
ncbi:MAG: hypothetical protein ACYTDT_00415 [Planctomycetota bacterium]|jgi:hypothetical protein